MNVDDQWITEIQEKAEQTKKSLITRKEIKVTWIYCYRGNVYRNMGYEEQREKSIYDKEMVKFWWKTGLDSRDSERLFEPVAQNKRIKDKKIEINWKPLMMIWDINECMERKETKSQVQNAVWHVKDFSYRQRKWFYFKIQL